MNGLLQAKDIHVGVLLWYSGSKGKYTWDCPAQITSVDPVKKLFQVLRLSLDYPDEEHYPFELDTPHAPAARATMLHASVAQVQAYRLRKKTEFEDQIANLEAQLKNKRANLNHSEDTFRNLIREALEPSP